jgi:hypothetical protein
MEMVKTESDAARSWCPMVRHPTMVTNGRGGTIVGVAAGNVSGDGDSQKAPNCIGSRCMLWRWAESEAQAAERLHASPAAPGRLGYCGLAGEPKVWP